MEPLAGILPLLLSKPLLSGKPPLSREAFPIGELVPYQLNQGRFLHRFCTPETPWLCLDGVSSAISSPGNLRLAAVRTSNITTVSRLRLLERDSGSRTATFDLGEVCLAESELSAGPWGLWSSATRSEYQSLYPVASYKTEQHSAFVGADHPLTTHDLLVGLSVGWDTTDTETFFNSGTHETGGLVLAPYLVASLGEVFSVDASLGQAWIRNDQRRIRLNRDRIGSDRLSSHFDSLRSFAQTSLNASYDAADWVLDGRLGALYLEERQDGYTESARRVTGLLPAAEGRRAGTRTLVLGQAFASLDLAYSTGDWEPYASAGYRRDLARDDGSPKGVLPRNNGPSAPRDDDELELAMGMRYFGPKGLSGGLEALKTLGRNGFDNVSVMLTLRLELD